MDLPVGIRRPVRHPAIRENVGQVRARQAADGREVAADEPAPGSVRHGGQDNAVDLGILLCSLAVSEA